MSTTLVARAGNKLDKLEKARQSAASLTISNVYQYILAGILFVLLIRNVAYRTRLFLAQRRRRNHALLNPANSEKGSTPASSEYHTESVFFRALGAIDNAGSQLVGVRFLGDDCTWFRLLFTTFITALNLTFCLIIDTHLITPASANSNVTRAFSRRCGRIAVANLPILFTLAGRNNIVSLITGFDYQSVKFYHKVLGWTVLLETIIHVICYCAYYVVSLGAEKLYEEYTELYFKLGIVATVGGAMIAIGSVSIVRRSFYEIFLILHVIGAAMFLAGSWYHRPIIEPWVYAASAIWIFERVCRLISHLAGVLHTRVVLRRPLLQAEATVVSGAILLNVPFPAGTWEAGQHCYISFWGREVLSKPWLYGQSHPFSIITIPKADGTPELRFALRIKKGVTRTLANHILAVTNNTSKPVPLTVSVEGPYGHTPFLGAESLLLVAGGSGVTHVASLLAEAIKKVKEGVSATSYVRFVWAVHHLDQVGWIDTGLDDARTLADAAGLKLDIDVYVTRPDSTSSETPSQESSRTSSPELGSSDEKKSFDFEGKTLPVSRAVVHHGRPEVAEIVRKTVETSEGYTLCVACGPDSLAHTVRRVATEMASSALAVEIARFEN
ncbi:ferric-chelate reductase [Pseudohyphozyma bogoriensis]|nr:ferric-chelate reductase [Pseudohyphozyma bogoriensis]